MQFNIFNSCYVLDCFQICISSRNVRNSLWNPRLLRLYRKYLKSIDASIYVRAAVEKNLFTPANFWPPRSDHRHNVSTTEHYLPLGLKLKLTGAWSTANAISWALWKKVSVKKASGKHVHRLVSDSARDFHIHIYIHFLCFR